MNFIKLTQLDDSPCIVHLEHIFSVLKLHNGFTAIVYPNINALVKNLIVKETVEQVEQKIEEAKGKLPETEYWKKYAHLEDFVTQRMNSILLSVTAHKMHDDTFGMYETDRRKLYAEHDQLIKRLADDLIQKIKELGM